MAHHRLDKADTGRTSLRIGVGALPLALAVACAGVSLADPAQPGATQPGTTAPAQPGATPRAQPGITAAPPTVAPPSSPQVRDDQAAPATDYGRYRSIPQVRYAAPVNPGELHAPRAERPVAPVLAPPGTIRLGDFMTPAPAWIPKNVQYQINSQAAQSEAQIDTFARAVGVRAHRADKVAGGAETGAAIGFGVGAIPGAALGAAFGLPIGATIGFVVGLVGGAIIGCIPGLLIGGALGALAVGALGGAATGALVAGPGALVGGAASLLQP